jgi:hypothetical protein
VNGAVETVNALRGEPYPYKMKNRLFHNNGGKGFSDVSEISGPALQLEAVGRGLAIGDLTNDGRTSMIATANNGQPLLLLNQDAAAGHWLLVELQGVKTNRQGLGAEVGVLRAGQKTLWRRSHPDGSYASSSDPRVHFGLGRDTKIDGVAVRWVGGASELFRDIKPDSIVKLREGAGQPWQ